MKNQTIMFVLMYRDERPLPEGLINAVLKMWMLENDQLVETRSEGPRMGHTDPREK